MTTSPITVLCRLEIQGRQLLSLPRHLDHHLRVFEIVAIELERRTRSPEYQSPSQPDLEEGEQLGRL